MAHQSITSATILYNPSQTVQDLAGWRGDTTTDAEATPSMGNDDYKADLDAVNLAKRMKNGQSYFSASNEYYRNASQNREKEFLANEGGYDKVSNRIFTSMVPGYNDPTQHPHMSEERAMAYLEQHNSEIYKFLQSLKDEKNYFES